VTLLTAASTGLAGAVCALGWALRFYVQHAWPLVALASVPAIVKMSWALRGPGPQVMATGRSSAFEGLVAAWPGVMMLLVAGLDLEPGLSWWESLWPGVWASALGGRIAAIADHGWEWAWLAAGVAVAVTLLAGAIKLLTTPRLLTSLFRLLRARPAKARQQAEAVGFGIGNLITIPLTTLMIYAAIARASECLRP
jgi:hypothetical protein